VLPDDDDPPPPQPAISPAQSASARVSRMVWVRVTAAPVYSSRVLRPLAITLALAGLLAGLLAQSGGAAPVAHTSSFSACDISGKQQNLGASYVTSLKVQGVSCTKGEKVVKAYHQCRHQSGGPAGTCGATLLGFKCKDGKRTGVPNVQYNATAKCHKVSNASKRIKSRYTQNT
jgi:hypothetical protein